MRIVLYSSCHDNRPTDRDLLRRAGAAGILGTRDAIRAEAARAGEHLPLLDDSPHAALQRMRPPGRERPARRAARAGRSPPPPLPAVAGRTQGAEGVARRPPGRPLRAARPRPSEAFLRRGPRGRGGGAAREARAAPAAISRAAR